ncbi:MAG: type II secretion system protein GspG [Candidatus Omnitrophota bacterium]
MNTSIREHIRVRAVYKALAILLGISVLVAIFFIHPIPPEATTVTIIRVLTKRVLQYAQTNNKPPNSLDLLPELHGTLNSTKDGWNREILFYVNDDYSVTFKSFGRDGVEGGEGENKDIVEKFELRDKEGKWKQHVRQSTP